MSLNRPLRALPTLTLALVLAAGTAGGLAAAPVSATAPVTPANASQASGNAARLSEPMARERDRLFETLKAAPDARAGRIAEDAVWQFWMRSAPSPGIEKQIAEAMRARSSYNFGTARRILDAVVRAAPDYAEAWNQRAFILFLLDDPDASLADIDRCLELEPKHFGALAGKANILMRQGRVELARQALRRAVAIHPWLKERHMLPAPEGERI